MPTSPGRVGRVAAGTAIGIALLALPGPGVETGSVAAVPQSDLGAADPTLVRDGDRWVSLSTNETLGGTSPGQARPCDPDDEVWNKEFAYVPYRVGPAPWRLGDCWAGDAMPGGPGPWADRPPEVGMRLWAPSIAKINDVWWLFYTARKDDSGQQCIGVAASNRATGPGWFHKEEPLVCPENGQWAIDPEIFYDRETGAWYLLWAHGSLNIQRFDPETVSLVGTERALLRGDHPDLGFDESRREDGTIASVIENPTMIRAANGQLWLFFSANQWRSGDYATGWGICGGGSPVAGEGCALINSFDSGSRHRPLWGWSQRTAPVEGVNASPFLAFPDLPGLGGMSVTGTDPAYATAHVWNGPGTRRSQHVYRLDTSGTLPALFEPETVTIHGKDGTFGDRLGDGASPSGHALTTRAVPGWGFPAGHRGIFNSMTRDGTMVIAGANTDVADGMVAGGVYDPKRSEWTNVRARTSGGAESVAPIEEGGGLVHGGAEAWEVEEIDDGRAVAIANIFGVPQTYLDRNRIPVEGVWPSLGVIAKEGDEWRVVAQWSAADLARSNLGPDPDQDADERACRPYKDLPGETSLCGGPNEMTVTPRSRDLIVALYAGDGVRTSGGLMAVRVDRNAAGEYSAKIVGYYAYPEVEGLGIAPKTVEADPTGVPGDERFSMVADIFGLGEEDPSVTQEFSYDSTTGKITPVSAPFIAGATSDGFRGVHGGVYDYQGNLWALSNGIVVYASGPDCPFDLARWETEPESYTSTAGGRTVWGQTCRPDYDILQAKHVGGGANVEGFLQLAEDPHTRTMVGIDTWATGNVLAIRHSGTGLNKSFTVGNLVDTGRNLLPRLGRLEQRPPAFDRTGRMWASFQQWPPEDGPPDPLNHWVVSADVNRLFDPVPPTLPDTPGEVVRVQAEQTTTTGTTQRTAANGVVLVDSGAFFRKCTGGCGGHGFMLADDSGFGHLGGAVEYDVYVPEPGEYDISFHATRFDVSDNAAIQVEAGGAGRTVPVKTDWQPTDPITIELAEGHRTIRLSPPPGGGGWYLNWFTLTRR